MKSEKPTPHPHEPSIGPGFLPTEEPAKKRGPAFLKLKPDQRIAAICISPIWTGAITHYYARRMHLHTGNDCPFCAHGSDKRFYAWIHIASDDLARQFVLQLPSSARPVLSKQYDIHGTLRGCHLHAFRDGKHANTPTAIEWRSGPDNHITLPEPFDVTGMLLTLMAPTATHTDLVEPLPDPNQQKELPL